MSDEAPPDYQPLPPRPPRPAPPPESKVDLRDVMPNLEPPAPDVPPDPTLVELIAADFKQDDRRATDIAHLLK